MSEGPHVPSLTLRARTFLKEFADIDGWPLCLATKFMAQRGKPIHEWLPNEKRPTHFSKSFEISEARSLTGPKAPQLLPSPAVGQRTQTPLSPAEKSLSLLGRADYK